MNTNTELDKNDKQILNLMPFKSVKKKKNSFASKEFNLI